MVESRGVPDSISPVPGSSQALVSVSDPALEAKRCALPSAWFSSVTEPRQTGRLLSMTLRQVTAGKPLRAFSDCSL